MAGKLDPVEVRRLIEETGMSQSAVARQFDTKVSIICNLCKRHGIKSKFAATPKKSLPIEEIYAEYVIQEVSMNALMKKYNTPVLTIRRQLEGYDPNISFRTHDEAVRPPELNDMSILSALMAEMSQRKIAKKLGVGVSTVGAAVHRLGLDQYIRTNRIDVPDSELVELYVDHERSLKEIADAYGTYPTTIARRLRNAGTTLRGFGKAKPSKHEKLNDREWLVDTYETQQKSMAFIAGVVNTSVGNVSHFLDKHKIRKRSHKEVIRLILAGDHSPKQQKVETKFGKMTLRSKKEHEFVTAVGDTVKELVYEPVELEYNGLIYVPDFMVDGEYVEIKPESRAQHQGVNRRKFMKQFMIARHNRVKLRTWYKKFFDVDEVGDADKYHALDWRLFFGSATECYDFLINHRWEQPTLPDENLNHGLVGWLSIPRLQRLNANLNKPQSVQALKSFHGNFYDSRHAGYSSVIDAFRPGNRRVLKEAVEEVWGKSKSCNIFGLISVISTSFKDFAQISIFKPWVAREVYERLLPGGGTVVDPCAGWGGRMVACIESEYEYRGSDLNPVSVANNAAMKKFLGNRFIYEPELSVADASEVVGAGDLLFTSPPYDDTERYDGLPVQCSDTGPIYDRIFSEFDGIVALNVPLRHAEKTVATARKHGWSEGDHIEMKTANFIRRDKTTEPILVFR